MRKLFWDRREKREKYETERKVPVDKKRSRSLRRRPPRPDRILGNRGIWRQPSEHNRVPYTALGHHRVYRYVDFFHYNGCLDGKKSI